MLVLGVAGVSIYSLGITSSLLVSLFHEEPIHRSAERVAWIRTVESHFGAIGICSMLLGATLAAISVVSGNAYHWEMARVWLWLFGSALFVLVGLQFVISWVITRVLEKLAEREKLIDGEIRRVDQQVDRAPSRLVENVAVKTGTVV